MVSRSASSNGDMEQVWVQFNRVLMDSGWTGVVGELLIGKTAFWNNVRLHFLLKKKRMNSWFNKHMHLWFKSNQASYFIWPFTLWKSRTDQKFYELKSSFQWLEKFYTWEQLIMLGPTWYPSWLRLPSVQISRVGGEGETTLLKHPPSLAVILKQLGWKPFSWLLIY